MINPIEKVIQWKDSIYPSVVSFDTDPMTKKMADEVTHLIRIFCNKKNRAYHYESCEKMILNFREKWHRYFSTADGILMVESQISVLYAWLNKHLFTIESCDSCE